MEILKFQMPETPPSLNHYLMRHRFGVYKTKGAKEFQERVAVAIHNINKDTAKFPMSGELEIDLKFVFKDKRRRDWDNYAKVLCDAMNGIVYVDDSQIKKATVEMLVGREARTVIEISRRGEGNSKVQKSKKTVPTAV